MFYGSRTIKTLAAVVATLLVMAFAYSAFAVESFEGKVTAIDNARKIVTVRSAAGDEKMFTLTNTGQVFKCGKAMTWDTLKVGEKVTIAYFEKTAGNYVADFLTLSPDIEKC